MNLRCIAFALLSSIGLSSVGRAETIELVAGGTRDAVDVPATEAILREPFGTEFDREGRAWIVEISSGNRLLHIDGSGLLRHKAGKPPRALAGDGGPAREA